MKNGWLPGVLLALLALTVVPAAHGADLFGLGSRNAALAGSVSAVCDDGNAAWYNPALLATTNRGGLAVSYLTVFPEVDAAVTNYGSLGRVPAYQQVGPEGGLSGAETRAWLDALYGGAADLDRFAGVGVSFAVRFQTLFPELPFALVLGGGTLVPDGGRSLASFTAQTADQPFFPSWNTPFNQLSMNLGLGAEVWPGHLWLGAGLSVHSRVEGGVVTLNPIASYDEDHPEKNPPTPSAAATEQELGLTAAPTAGLAFQPAPWGRLALVYHAEEKTTIELGATATMELDLGEPLRMEVPYVMSGTFAYRPHRVVGGLAWLHGERLTVSAEVELGLWSRFADHLQILTMKVSEGALAEDSTLFLEDLGGRVRVASEAVPEVRLRNTWTPRVGVEYRFAFGLDLRAGYSYRMSPLTEDQGHLNMLMDNNWHAAAAGVGYRFWRSHEGTGELAVSAHFQGLFLEPRYQAVGKGDADGSSLAAGWVHTEGFMMGFGVEVSSRF